jgi:hypothetical protein
MPCVFVGTLAQPSEAALVDEGLVLRAELVATIVPEALAPPPPPPAALPCAVAPSPIEDLVVANAPLGRRNRNPKKQKDSREMPRVRNVRTSRLNYYACTRNGCGWSGNRPSVHAQVRPRCRSYPCSLHYEKGGGGARRAVASFLSSCTPRQRELGLPPDFARPVPMLSSDGTIDHSMLYLTVPQGLTSGDAFHVPLGQNMRARVVVPPDHVAGDVVSVFAPR